MRRTFIIGIAAALIGAIGMMIGDMFAIPFSNALLGIGAGFIVAMVRQGSPVDRIVGFLIGAGLGTLFSAQRFGYLPGGLSPAGVLVVVVLILLVIAVVAGLTKDRVRAWSMLLGLLTFAAGYNAVLLGSPGVLEFNMGSIFLSLLSTSAIGFLLVVVVEIFPENHKLFQKKDKQASQKDATAPAETSTDLQGVMGEQS